MGPPKVELRENLAKPSKYLEKRITESELRKTNILIASFKIERSGNG